MSRGSGTKSPAQQLLQKEHRITGIPKEMGKRSGDSIPKSMDHACSEKEHKRTETR